MKRKLKLKQFLSVAGYTIFALAVLMLFLYLRFPGDVLVRYLHATASTADSGLVLHIDAAKPSIPPGLTFKNVALALQTHPPASLQVDTITVRPAFMSLLRGRTAAILGASAYGGTVRGRMDTSQFMSLRGPVDATMTAEDIDMGKIGFLKDRLGREITGQLKGSLIFNGPFSSLLTGTATLECTFSNGRYPLPMPLLGMDHLDVKSLEASLNLKNGILTINRFKLNGDKLNGTLTGAITLNATDIGRSEINLNGTVELPAQNKKMSMALTGPLASPRIRYL